MTLMWKSTPTTRFIMRYSEVVIYALNTITLVSILVIHMLTKSARSVPMFYVNYIFFKTFDVKKIMKLSVFLINESY